MTTPSAHAADDAAGSAVDPAAHDGRPCGRDALSPLAIPAAGWSDVLWRVRGEIRRDNMVVVAAGVAFFGLLAMVPSIGVLVSLYGLLADPQDVARHLAAFSSVIPAAGGALVRDTLDQVVSHSRTSLSLRVLLGIAVAIWSSSHGMRALMRGLAIAYDEPPARGWLRERARSYVFTAAGLVLLALSIALVVTVPALAVVLRLSSGAAAVVSWLRWPLLMVILCAALAALYRYGAGRRPAQWRWTIAGALVATALWLLGSAALSLYVHHAAHLHAGYGPLGAFVVLMLWCFVTAFAILLGAELNAELEHQTSCDTTVGPPLPAGERGAYVADHLGACRPRIDRMVREGLARTRAAAQQARKQVERVRQQRAREDD